MLHVDGLCVICQFVCNPILLSVIFVYSSILWNLVRAI